MEYKITTLEEIWSSSSAKLLIDLFNKQSFSPDEYSLVDFKEDLVGFFSENSRLVSSIGINLEYMSLFHSNSLKHADLFRQVLTCFVNEIPHHLSKVLSDFLLQINIKEGRNSLSRRTSRTATTAGMYDNSLVDKSELMFY